MANCSHVGEGVLEHELAPNGEHKVGVQERAYCLTGMRSDQVISDLLMLKKGMI